jgi:preprotein translocase subunit SecE
MAMNRETKRMLQRQGHDIGPDGELAPSRPQPRAVTAPSQRRERTSAPQFLREVRQELLKVAWPSREEIIKYSAVVLFTLVLLTSLIFVLDWAAAKSVLFLFDK